MIGNERQNEITEKIIGAAYRVSNNLGVGFLEKVYENALVYELKREGLKVEQQSPIKVLYEGVVMGEYYADILVEGLVIVELKATKRIEDIFLAQCINYLKGTGLKLGLILNFGTPRVQIKRVVHNH
ncbi:MAG: hypothetical protein QG552_1608 [Thermodesulfobacteriota bacterium]|nr:hypothetical protein [Thermodesulfobacteriota bacterium]